MVEQEQVSSFPYFLRVSPGRTNNLNYVILSKAKNLKPLPHRYHA